MLYNTSVVILYYIKFHIIILYILYNNLYKILCNINIPIFILYTILYILYSNCIYNII